MATDKQILADGDNGFFGINMRIDPASLEQGMASDARNMVFRNGVAETRLGVIKPAWLNNIQPETTGKQINPWTAAYGVGTYKDPDSEEFIILAAEGDVYYCKENNDPNKLTLPTGVRIISDVTFVQAFNKVMMFRGINLAPLVLNSIDNGFEDLVAHYDSTATYTADESEVAWGPWKSVTSIAHSDGVATVTLSDNHGYVTGADITIRGASESEFNGRFNITKTGDKTFTFTVTSSNSAATGTITCSNMQDYWKADPAYTAGNEPGVTNWTQSTIILPNAEIAEYIQNRIVVGTSFNSSTLSYSGKKDFLFCSDLLDYKHVFFTNQFRINEGSDDELVDMLKLNDNQLILFKTKSAHLLTNFTISGTNTELSNNVSLETLVPDYGATARGSAVLVGTDVYFYAGRRGVVSMKQSEQGKVQGVDLPISEPIQPLIDRIDPRFEHLIRLAYADNRLWIAAPLDDGSDGNNCILVYDFLNRSWSGRYDGSSINVKEFFLAFYKGSERLFFMGNDGYVNLLEESSHGDEVRDTARENNIGIEEIASLVTTRGYHHDDLNQRFFRSGRMSLGTWYPQYSVSAIMDGASERQELAGDRVKSRTTYYRPFDKEPYNITNENADHDTPYREDYSSAAPAGATALLTEAIEPITTEAGGHLTTEDPGGIVLGSSFNPFKFQETQEAFKLAAREGRYSQMELSNNQGRIQLKQAIMTTEKGAQGIQVKS